MFLGDFKMILEDTAISGWHHFRNCRYMLFPAGAFGFGLSTSW
jgi:hypothetical protein